MVKGIINLVKCFFKGEVVLDYGMQMLNRKRLISVPKVTNYIRLSNFELVVAEIQARNLTGDVAEVGVYKGNFAKYINAAFPEKKLYLFDTFEGFDAKDIEVEKNNNFSDGGQDFANTSVELVLSKMTNRDNCIVKKGYFPESLNGLEAEFCFVSLDPDLYKPIYDGLTYFYPRLQKGGYIFIHDYNNDAYPGAKQAVKDYCLVNNIPWVPITDNWGTVVIAK
jgi:O-methyltransferase